MLLSALLNSTAHSLRRLTLAMDKTADLQAVFPRNSTFPLLEHLEVTVRDFNDPVCTALTHIRSLAIRTQGLVSTSVQLFLSLDISSRRPIHTVELDYAKYEQNGGETAEYIPRWQDIFSAFDHFQFSAVPIRHLRFFVTRLLIPHLQLALDGLACLESVTMVVWHEPKQKRYDHRDHFWFARDVAMQRALLAEYEKHTSVLRRIAFTTEFEWENRDDGRWITTDPVVPEVREEPEEWIDESASDYDPDDE
ncbi:hypothetical protein L226DRAFT_615631 [Lentinus tigrinus ALCF2SS1-7]|uniref:uncharacterized protein n=1 Tax=Lentinus tigrinus ALCF2SS1-7 TaxID=1328758 RepID=UPI0011661B9A|nr:hypothetical protein L226DRAFT_615631 [Lentinus tigrinus ALCF2SS1-7]